jgi:hypothetical protein
LKEMREMKTTSVIAGALAVVLLVATACSKRAEDPGAAAPEGRGAGEAEESINPAGAEGRGWLEIQGADLIGHEIRKAGTTEKVATASSVNATVELDAGLYDVDFGRSVWTNVQVTAGQTTRLSPGAITLVGASLQGHEVADEATGTAQGSISSLKNSITLIPGKYLVKFGPLDWPVEVAAGRTTTITAGVVEVDGADIQGHSVRTVDGTAVGEVSATQSSLPLPPGEYIIVIDGQDYPFTLKEGERRTFSRK